MNSSGHIADLDVLPEHVIADSEATSVVCVDDAVVLQPSSSRLQLQLGLTSVTAALTGWMTTYQHWPMQLQQHGLSWQGVLGAQGGVYVSLVLEELAMQQCYYPKASLNPGLIGQAMLEDNQPAVVPLRIPGSPTSQLKARLEAGLTAAPPVGVYLPPMDISSSAADADEGERQEATVAAVAAAAGMQEGDAGDTEAGGGSSNNNMPLDEAVFQSLMAVAARQPDVLDRLSAGILLVGPGASLRGLGSMLERRVMHKFATLKRQQVVSVLEPRAHPAHIVWFGGALLAALDSGRENWTSRQQFACVDRSPCAVPDPPTPVTFYCRKVWQQQAMLPRFYSGPSHRVSKAGLARHARVASTNKQSGISRHTVVEANSRLVLRPTGNGSYDHIGDEVSLPQTIPLKDGVFEVGRAAPADIQINVPTVSSRHALLRVEDNKISITDLNSTNGTVVNGQELTPMDDLTRFEFECATASAVAGILTQQLLKEERASNNFVVDDQIDEVTLLFGKG
eukprot:gene9147-9315_t